MRPKAIIIFVVAVIAVVGTLLVGCNESEIERSEVEQGSTAAGLNKDPGEVRQLVFGVYSADKPSTVYEQFIPTLDAIAQALTARTKVRHTVVPKIFKTYEEGRTALIEGRVDFSRMGPASFVLAERQNEDLQLLAMELKKGKKRFRGLIVVDKDSAFKTLADLKGSRFAFGDKTSTIGRYLAQAEMLNVGIKAADLSTYRYLGRHDLVFKSVEVGDYDAGSLKESTFKKLNVKGELRVLHAFWNVSKPWIASSTLDSKLVRDLSAVLLEMKDTKTLKHLKASGFASATAADYDMIRKSMTLASAFDSESP